MSFLNFQQAPYQRVRQETLATPIRLASDNTASETCALLVNSRSWNRTHPLVKPTWQKVIASFSCGKDLLYLWQIRMKLQLTEYGVKHHSLVPTLHCCATDDVHITKKGAGNFYNLLSLFFFTWWATAVKTEKNEQHQGCVHNSSDTVTFVFSGNHRGKAAAVVNTAANDFCRRLVEHGSTLVTTAANHVSQAQGTTQRDITHWVLLHLITSDLQSNHRKTLATLPSCSGWLDVNAAKLTGRCYIF